jgi:hypothetical protein
LLHEIVICGNQYPVLIAGPFQDHHWLHLMLGTAPQACPVVILFAAEGGRAMLVESASPVTGGSRAFAILAAVILLPDKDHSQGRAHGRVAGAMAAPAPTRV